MGAHRKEQLVRVSFNDFMWAAIEERGWLAHSNVNKQDYKKLCRRLTGHCRRKRRNDCNTTR